MVYVMLAEGFEELEAVTIITVLRRGGATVSTVSITGQKLVNGVRGIPMMADILIETADFGACEMIALPGGIPGASNLAKSEALMSAVTDFSAEGKWVAAICAAPAEVLGKAGLLQGYRATGYSGSEENLLGAEAVDEKVVVSGKFVTSQGPGTALEFALKLVELLKGEAVVKEVKGKMLVK